MLKERLNALGMIAAAVIALPFLFVAVLFLGVGRTQAGLTAAPRMPPK